MTILCLINSREIFFNKKINLMSTNCMLLGALRYLDINLLKFTGTQSDIFLLHVQHCSNTCHGVGMREERELRHALWWGHKYHHHQNTCHHYSCKSYSVSHVFISSKQSKQFLFMNNTDAGNRTQHFCVEDKAANHWTTDELKVTATEVAFCST